MQWNWQLPDWPDFSWNGEAMAAAEAEFLRKSGRVTGAFSHVDASEQDRLRIELISDEAIQTSRIEGEILDRASVQSSIRRHFGLSVDREIPVRPAEKGIADLLMGNFRTWQSPLSIEALHAGHRMLLTGRLETDSLGRFRSGDQPMLIVSGNPFDPEIHFEAPPSEQVSREMTRFLEWLNATAPTDRSIPLPALTRAGIAHLWFESIHPFTDGNGRIGRVIAEKALFQAAGQPILIALSQVIEAERKHYYGALAETRFTNEITGWLQYFGAVVLQSLEASAKRITFLIRKTRFFDRHGPGLNTRQEKVLLRMFREGPAGFKGGLSAGNYISIARTSPATARRDLGALVKIGALTRTGERKGTRYFLAP